MSECITHHHACDCREARMRELEQAAKDLAGAYFRMELHGFIMANDDDEDSYRHFRDIAEDAMQTIRRLTT